jgi:tetratricopeptide (TPR) repeat protein
MINCRVIARLFGVLAWAGTIAAMPLCAGHAADKPSVASEAAAARLLELGDRYSPDALTKVRAYYGGLAEESQDDARVQYALVLVLIRQHSHKEAVELLDKAIAREPDGVHLWRAKIWVEMAAHKEHEALADIRLAADVLAKQSPAALPAAEAKAWRTTAAFLGRVIGFLDVPRANALPADEVRGAKQYVLTKLGDDRTAFNQNEELVAKKFSQVRATLEGLRAKRVAAGTTKQEALGQQKKVIDETETSVDYDTQKVKANTIAEVDQHNQSAESLQKYLVACEFRLDAVHKSILNAQDALFQQALASEQTAQGITAGRYNQVTMARNSQQIQNSLLRLTAEENVLIQQIKMLSAQLQTTIDERNLLLDTGEKTTAELKSKADTLKRDEKRLERAEKAEAKKIAAERHKSLMTKQTAFAMFEPFPFDAEKQRVLGTADP